MGIVPLLIGLGLFIFLLTKIKINNHTRIGLTLVLNLSILALFTSPSNSIPIMLIGILGVSILSSYSDLKPILMNIKKTSTVIRVVVVSIAMMGIYMSSSKMIGKEQYKDYYSQHRGNIDKNKLITLSKSIENHGFSDATLGKKLYRSGYKEEGLFYLNRAFKITAAPKIGKALASYLINEGNYKSAEEIYTLNIGTEPYRYEPRMNLLSLY